MKTHIVVAGDICNNKRVALCSRELRVTNPLYTHITTWDATLHSWICKDCIKKCKGKSWMLNSQEELSQ
jgi:hypothetical protein